ncbi:MAG: leucyl/phenylalanyl-tRNA--protein transferase [Paracoccaceae bacterium]
MDISLAPETLIRAYCNGIFPMAEGKNTNKIFWISPEIRGVIPLNNFHISKSLRRSIVKRDYKIKINTDFVGVITNCADRTESWINSGILKAYSDLFNLGFCHSIEVWDNQDLIGGIYGLAIKRAFFGESMFSKRPDASKIALAYLVSRLKYGGFLLFDVQFQSEHLKTLGAIEVLKANYQDLLKNALEGDANFFSQPSEVGPVEICI